MSYATFERSRACREIQEMLNKGYTGFSATKIQPDVSPKETALPEVYFDSLDGQLNPAKFYFKPDMIPERGSTRVYIIGSKEDDAKEDTDKLIKLVADLPEGTVWKGIEQRCIDEKRLDDGGRYCLRRLKEDLKRIKAEGKKVLTVGYGPVFYDANGLKSVVELFLPHLERTYPDD